jgi:hypothetical protein
MMHGILNMKFKKTYLTIFLSLGSFSGDIIIIIIIIIVIAPYIFREPGNSM